MKPDGRALDIAAIGLGQAGGNLAAELFRRGYRALALNTAQTDLAALEPGGLVPMLPPERRLYVGLDGYDGAGSDPAYGRECIRAHADRIKAQVQKLAHDADAVIVCAGLGGGTGSALPTLVEILDEEDLPLIALMTLPTASESGLAKVNAVRTINEVVDASLLGWVFVDNGRLATLNPDVSIAEYYARVNAQVIAPLDDLNRLNAREGLRSIRSFDGEDFRKLLLAGGILSYATATLPSMDAADVVDTARRCIEHSDVMPAGFDLARLSYLGVILEAPEPALAQASFASLEQIHESLKRHTDGAAIYQGTYRTEADTITLRLLAVTQTLPERIRALLGDAKREGQIIGAKAQEELPALELGEVQGLDLFRTHARPTERPRRPRASSGRRARSTGAPLPAATRGAPLPPESEAPDPGPTAPSSRPPDEAEEPPARNATEPEGEAPDPGPAQASSRPLDEAGGPPARNVTEPEGTLAAALDGAPPPSAPADGSAAAHPQTGRAAREDDGAGFDRPAPAHPQAQRDAREDDGAGFDGPARADRDGPSSEDRLRLSRRPGGRRRPGAARAPAGPGRGKVEARPSLGRTATDGEIPTDAIDPPSAPDAAQPPETPSAAVDVDDLDAQDWLRAELAALENIDPGPLGQAQVAQALREPVEPLQAPERPELGTEEIDLVARLADVGTIFDEAARPPPSGLSRPPAADPEADTGDLPSPALYDRIVEEWGRAELEERRALQRRLERDSLSENSVVRYYAVEAMAKLGRIFFGNALLAATEDEDEAVRHLAVQALGA